MLIKRRSLLTGAAALAAHSRLAKAQTGSCGPVTFTAPSQAAAAGFSRLVFSDDFAVAGSIAPTTAPLSGYKWYLANGATSANAVVNTAATAASISNGNSGGGSFASSGGGVLSLNGPAIPGNGNVTIFSTPLATQKVNNPGFGCWGPNIYVEIYAQMNLSIYGPSNPANNQWYAPAWFWTQVPSTYQGNAAGEELDLIEEYAGNFGYANNNGTFSGHVWSLNGTTSTVCGTPASTQLDCGGGSFGTGLGGSWTQISIDSNWHAYGFLWKTTGTNTGTLQAFYDNQPATIYWSRGFAPYATSALPVGTGGTAGFELLDNNSPLYAIMGGPPGANMNIDYFNVWSA